LDQDGPSLKTFFSRAKDYPWTLLVIKDDHNYTFGAFCLEAWHSSNGFFGSGHNFLYSFKDGE